MTKFKITLCCEHCGKPTTIEQKHVIPALLELATQDFEKIAELLQSPGGVTEAWRIATAAAERVRSPQ